MGRYGHCQSTRQGNDALTVGQAVKYIKGNLAINVECSGQDSKKVYLGGRKEKGLEEIF